MPFVAHPVPGQTIASAWGSLVADQVVMTFTTAAQRASQLPAPIVGQVTARNDNAGGLEVWSGTAWIPVGSPPGAWNAYTPTWTAGGSSAGLALGTAGVLTGRWRMIAPYTLAVAVTFTPGTAGFNGGVGAWLFGFPAGYSAGVAVSSHAVITGAGIYVGSSHVGLTGLSPASTGAAGVAAAYWAANFPLNPWTNAYTARIGAILQVGERW